MKRFASLSTLCAALAALTLTGGVVCLSAHSANAQVKQGKKGNRAAGGARTPIVEAFKAVGPTADAQAKFDALYTTYESDLKTIGTDRKARAERMAKLRTDADALLTPDQVTKFHQAITVMPIMQHLDRELMLTPDEKTKIEPILNDYATKTEGMKGKEKRTALEEVKGKVRETLTPDQQTKLDAMPSLAAGGGRRAAAGTPAPTTVTPPVAPPPAPTAPTTP